MSEETWERIYSKLLPYQKEFLKNDSKILVICCPIKQRKDFLKFTENLRKQIYEE